MAGELERTSSNGQIMNHTLTHVFNRYKITTDAPTDGKPIEIPSVGRYSLAYLFDELGFTEGVEIGVETGGFSEWLCRHNGNLHLFGIDPWTAYAGYREHVSQEELDSFHATAKVRLHGLNCTLIRKFSLAAVKDFGDESLDFVFIDGNHDYQNTVNDICEWSKKVKVGGIVSGHDYVRSSKYPGFHVYQAVNGYVDAFNIKPWFILGEKRYWKSGKEKHYPRSYMWVKL